MYHTNRKAMDKQTDLQLWLQQAENKLRKVTPRTARKAWNALWAKLVACKNANGQPLAPATIRHSVSAARGYAPENCKELIYTLDTEIVNAHNTQRATSLQDMVTSVRTISPAQFAAWVTQAQSDLKSFDWKARACAIALLTGRRQTEVLKTAKFSKGLNKNTLAFSGQLKSDKATYIIPTLVPAAEIIKAHSGLSTLLPFAPSEMSEIEVEHAANVPLNRYVKKSYDEALHFHDLRKLYAAKAVQGCPESITPRSYLAQILGHAEMKTGQHYENFRIAE